MVHEILNKKKKTSECSGIQVTTNFKRPQNSA